MDAIAKMSVEIENIGPDVMSDMVANFGMHHLIEYTQEQAQSLGIKTIIHRWILYFPGRLLFLTDFT